MNYELKFGEGKIIANECGVSTTTFKKAIKGEINTPLAQLIRMHTEIVIIQRESRVDTMNKLLKDLKEKKDA